MSRPTEIDTGRQRVSADTWAWVVPSSRAASVCVSRRCFRTIGVFAWPESRQKQVRRKLSLVAPHEICLHDWAPKGAWDAI